MDTKSLECRLGVRVWSRDVLRGARPRPDCHFEGPHGEILMLTKKALLVVFCSLVFPICPLLYGQATGSFFGTATDKTGAVVSGGRVKPTTQGTGVSLQSK